MGSGHLLEVRLRIKASPSLFAGSSNTMASCPCCAGAAGSVRTSGSDSLAKYNCFGQFSTLQQHVSVHTFLSS